MAPPLVAKTQLLSLIVRYYNFPNAFGPPRSSRRENWSKAEIVIYARRAFGVLSCVLNSFKVTLHAFFYFSLISSSSLQRISEPLAR